MSIFDRNDNSGSGPRKEEPDCNITLQRFVVEVVDRQSNVVTSKVIYARNLDCAKKKAAKIVALCDYPYTFEVYGYLKGRRRLEDRVIPTLVYPVRLKHCVWDIWSTFTDERHGTCDDGESCNRLRSFIRFSEHI